MKDMASLTTDAALMLGDSANGIWSLAELQRYTKDGYSRLLRSTRALWKQKYLNDRAGQAHYDLPSDCIEIDRATWNNKPLPLESEGNIQMRDDQYLNEDETGSEPKALFLSGIDTVGLYPVPATSVTTTDSDYPETTTVLNTRLEYFSTGADLDSNPFEIPDYWTRSIRHYVIGKAYERKGPGHNKKLAEHFMARWEIDLARFAKLRHSLASMVVGHVGPRKRFPSSRRPAEPRLPWAYGKVVRG